jgi:hypothetical protein
MGSRQCVTVTNTLILSHNVLSKTEMCFTRIFAVLRDADLSCHHLLMMADDGHTLSGDRELSDLRVCS